jgi:hypothetical protein
VKCEFLRNDPGIITSKPLLRILIFCGTMSGNKTSHFLKALTTSSVQYKDASVEKS